jgi:hypothetical protein
VTQPSRQFHKALDLAGKGYSVFPLKPGAKTPITANGFKDATNDGVQVAKWWTDNPAANIGIRTGAGLVVIDVDRLPQDGRTKAIPNPWLEPLGERLESLAADHVVESPTGGFHLYFRTDREIRSSAGEIAPGIDVRGDGGYIVGPGSEIDGREYRELDHRRLVDLGDLPPLPPALIADFDRIAAEKGRSKAQSGPQAPPRGRKAIEEGQRHTALVREAARLRGLGLGGEAIAAELHRFNLERCSPPQDDADVDRIASDFAEKDASEPWRLDLRKASEVERVPVEWLIGQRLLRGSINTIVGMPGCGKSILTTFIASKVSTGRGLEAGAESWPPREPANVLMFTFEDGMGEFVRPRLERMGADLDRIDLCEVSRRGDQERGIDLLRDLPAIEEAILDRRPALVIVDPVNSAWASGKDQNDDVQVRAVLGPLSRLAAEHDVAIVLVTHTNKRSDVADAQDAASGARGIVGLSRATYLAGVLEEEDGSRTHYLCDLKVNPRAPAEALVFQVKAEKADAPDAWVEILGTEPMNALQFLGEKARRAREAREAKAESKVAEAKRIAIEILNGNGGAMLSAMLERVLVEERGLARKTVQEALKALGAEGVIERRKERCRNGRNWAFFPDSEPAALREDREDRGADQAR